MPDKILHTKRLPSLAAPTLTTLSKRKKGHLYTKPTRKRCKAHHPTFPFCYTVPVYVVKKSHFSKKRKNGQNQKKYCKAKLQYEKNE